MPRLIDDELFGKEPDGRVEDPDLIEGGLRSKSFATVVDLLGYGEIEGFRKPTNTNPDTADSLDFRRDIFLDGTPIVNADGSRNFQNVEIFFRSGTDDQTPLGSIDSFGPDRIENTIPVGVPILKDTSVARSITGVQDADGNELIKLLRVTIQIPSLQEFKDDGDIIGAEVKISIRITENDGTVHNPVVEDAINGKTRSPYVKDYEIDLSEPTSDLQFPLTVTVIRNTEDGTDPKLQNATNLLSITTIITESQAYAGFAYVGVRFNAQEFQSFPRRMYRVKGTKIKVPHDTTIDVDNGRVIYPADYTFNGTFKTDKEWCSDPAWILYDLLTTDKGFGGTDGVIDADTLDVFSFYSASAYNSELITDPITGTTEPRFSCNVIINQKNDAFTLINDLCSVMRAMPFYSVGSLTLSQDRPTNTVTNTSDAEYIFTNANVSDQGFTYTSVGQKVKFTEVEVSYFDNDTQTLNFEFVSADEITALSGYTTKFGKIRKTLKSFACTSRGQANRLARWFLYTNLKEAELCSFKATLEAGVVVRPSMIIGIADSMRAGVRRGGRIKSVTNTTTIVVDDANNTDLTAENSATLSVIMPDGSTESRSISSISGTTITVSSGFSTSPQANSIWAIENTTVEFQTYRVLGIEETNHCEYNISAIIHDTNKYSQVEDTTVAANPRTITTLLDEKPSPSNASAVEQIVVLNNRAVSKIFVTWQPVQGVKEYLVEFQYEKDNPERIRVARPSFELFESRLGTYTFAVKSINSLGKLSSSTTTIDSFQAVGKTALPEDPTGLTAEPVSDSFIRLRFNPSTSVDVTHGGTISVRHTSDTSTNANFANSTEIIPQLSGNISETLVPALTGTYSIKFIDDGGRRSANAAKIIVTKPDPQPNQVVVTKREDQTSPPFNGTKVRTVFSNEFNGLVLDGTQFFDNVADVGANANSGLANFDFLGGGIVSQGFYTFTDDLDLGSVFNLSVERHFKTAAIVVSDLWDSRVSLVNAMPDWDGTLAEDVGAKLQVATCLGVPTSSLASTYSQTQDLITINRSSHGANVNDQVLVDFTSGTASDGFLKVVTITNANVFVAEAVRILAEYEVVNATTGEIRFFTTGDHGGLVTNDTVNFRVLSGNLTSGDYTVGATLSLGIVKITTSSNNSITSGTLEFIKVKDSSGNNVTTSGNCNISSAFTPFNIFANGEYSARGFRFRAELFSNDPDENIEIDELGYSASIKRRTETVNAAIPSQCLTNNSAKTVVFGSPFFTGTTTLNSSTTAFLPTIGITLENSVAGDYFKITSVTGTQFVIETKDINNNFKDLSFKYTAIGFGKGV
jgi:predicted phage tail protein